MCRTRRSSRQRSIRQQPTQIRSLPTSISRPARFSRSTPSSNLPIPFPPIPSSSHQPTPSLQSHSLLPPLSPSRLQQQSKTIPDFPALSSLQGPRTNTSQRLPGRSGTQRRSGRSTSRSDSLGRSLQISRRASGIGQSNVSSEQDSVLIERFASKHTTVPNLDFPANLF